MSSLKLTVTFCAAIIGAMHASPAAAAQETAFEWCLKWDPVKHSQTETERLEQINVCMMGRGYGRKPECLLHEQDKRDCYRPIRIGAPPL